MRRVRKFSQAGLALVLLFSWRLTIAQSKVTVLSAGDGYPLAWAHVTFTSLGSLPSPEEQTVLTDVNGEAVSPFPGRTAIFISYVGFQPVYDTLDPGEFLTVRLKEDAIAIGDVVVTAQYSEASPDKAVHRVQIINSRQIKLHAATDLRDLLQYETNLRLSQDNILGTGLSLQGLSGQNVKILIDGVPVIGRLNGNIDISQINLNNIERVEIIEGPLSVNYGTNALAGTINLITKKEQDSKYTLEANAYYESVGRYNVDGSAGIRLGRSRLVLSGGRNFFDGYAIIDTSRHKDWKPKTQYFGTADFAFTSGRMNGSISTSYFWEKITNRGFRRKPYYETAFDDYYYTQRLDNRADLNWQLDEDHHIHMLGAYNRYYRVKNTYFKNLVTLEQMLTTNSGDQDTSLFDLINIRASYVAADQGSRLQYELGLDLNRESATGQRIEGWKQFIGDYAVFTTAEYRPLESLTIRPGLRYAWNTAYPAPLVPSVNIKFDVNPRLALRVSWARGFRAPSLKELNFLFVDINHNIHGNPNLLAEKSNNYSLALNYNKAIGLRFIRAEVSAFYNSIYNMITLAVVSGDLYSYVNIGTYRTVGGEARFSVNTQNLNARLGAALTGHYNDVAALPEVPKISATPEFTMNLVWKWPRTGLNTALFYKYTGRAPSFFVDENETLRENFIAAYHSADLTVSRDFWKGRITLSAGGKNLFDVKNVQASVTGGGAHSGSNSTVPVGWGRSWFFKLSVKPETGL